jgi:hypothetical protein
MIGRCYAEVFDLPLIDVFGKCKTKKLQLPRDESKSILGVYAGWNDLSTKSVIITHDLT